MSESNRDKKLESKSSNSMMFVPVTCSSVTTLAPTTADQVTDSMSAPVTSSTVRLLTPVTTKQGTSRNTAKAGSVGMSDQSTVKPGSSSGVPTQVSVTSCQAGPRDAAKKLTQSIQQHFEENNTQLKVAVYHLTKNENKEGICVIEKVMRMNQMREKQMASQMKHLMLRSVEIEQKVDSLKKREKFLLGHQADLQKKMESFGSIFDDDMEEPEQKKCLKDSLEKHEKFLLGHQTDTPKKMESFGVIFDDDMEEDEQKKCRKRLFDSDNDEN